MGCISSKDENDSLERSRHGKQTKTVKVMRFDTGHKQWVPCDVLAASPQFNDHGFDDEEFDMIDKVKPVKVPPRPANRPAEKHIKPIPYQYHPANSGSPISKSWDRIQAVMVRKSNEKGSDLSVASPMMFYGP